MANWTTGTRVRLSVMMFLQYAMYGVWIIPMGAYLSTLNFTGQQISYAYGTSALACMIAPFFVGMIADRFFAAQKLLGVMNLAGVATLYVASQLTSPLAFTLVLLVHVLFYMPTWALTNTIAMAQMEDPARQFPQIRVMGTLGWVVVSAVSLVCAYAEVTYETTTLPMMIGVGIGVAAGLFAFALPDTPPKPTGHKVTAGDILGLKALALLKQPNFLIFVLCSFLIMLPGAFYWGFCNLSMNELGMKAVAFKQSFGQMSEVVLMLFMPFLLVRFGVKTMMLAGMAAWVARFALFGFGNVGSLVVMFYLGFILHGACFDFFFVTGQIYTDKKASKEVQASAQGFISLVTFGVGMLVGNLLSGMVVDHYKVVDAAGKTIGHDWPKVWIIPMVMAAVIMVLFALAFKDDSREFEAQPPAA